jgi:hypothetical protein
VIGNPYFFTKEYIQQEKDDNALMRRAKREEDPNILSQQQMQIVSRLQDDFKGHLLRRTTKSKSWNGGQLLDLPPLVETMGILKLTDKEMQIVDQLSEEAKDM